MAIQLRRLTAREHLLCAAVLSFVMTFQCADMASPGSGRMLIEGHTVAAFFYSMSPAAVLVCALLIMLPRTGNDSHVAIFRLAGRLPLLIRYFAMVLIVVGICKIIEALI